MQKIKAILIVTAILIPSIASAYDENTILCASSFDDDTDINGTYTYVGMDYINYVYSNGDWGITGYQQYGQGFISPYPGGISQWYENTSGLEGTYVEAYVHPGYPSGADSGLVELGECQEPITPTIDFGTTTVATSTLQLVGSTTVGLAIIIVILSLGLIIYMNNQMFKRKPWQPS